MSATVRNLVEKLYPFAYSVTSRDSDRAVEAFRSELPFDVHEFASGLELNGWLVPPEWRVLKAEIRRDGKIVYDGMKSPLGVITLSKSFVGKVDLPKLKEHLYFSSESPDAIVYHWTALYRPKDRSWGFCVPRNLYESLEEGEYEVNLLSEEKLGTMKVLDYTLPGDSAEMILLNAHNCHPYQANDDISGCAVGIRVLQALAERPSRRFTYRLVIAPELIGTAFWLDKLGESARQLRYTIMLKSVGNSRPLRLQESFTGSARIDCAAHYVFKSRFGNYDSGKFRTIYGNDETVFEAPGYEIPSISLTRFPFFGYHTDLDTPELLGEDALQETVATTLAIIDTMEMDISPRFMLKGLVSLSNPRYDLYLAAPAPGVDKEDYEAVSARWNLLMNCLPRELDGKTPLLDIANRYELPLDQLYDYVAKWIDKSLAAK